MHKPAFLTAALVLLSFSFSAMAIDRDASRIDTIAVEGTQYERGDSLGGSLWGETATASRDRNWAVLFGGGLGTIWPDAGDGFDYWEVGLGLKYYPWPDTSAALRGIYRELSLPDDPDIFTTELVFKHRLISVDEPISPFVQAGVGSRVVESIPEPDIDKDFTEMLLIFGVGCDFMMAENFALVFSSTWYETEELDDGETADWWLGSVGMQYYWF